MESGLVGTAGTAALGGYATEEIALGVTGGHVVQGAGGITGKSQELLQTSGKSWNFTPVHFPGPIDPNGNHIGVYAELPPVLSEVTFDYTSAYWMIRNLPDGRANGRPPWTSRHRGEPLMERAYTEHRTPKRDRLAARNTAPAGIHMSRVNAFRFPLRFEVSRVLDEDLHWNIQYVQLTLGEGEVRNPRATDIEFAVVRLPHIAADGSRGVEVAFLVREKSPFINEKRIGSLFLAGSGGAHITGFLRGQIGANVDQLRADLPVSAEKFDKGLRPVNYVPPPPTPPARTKSSDPVAIKAELNLRKSYQQDVADWTASLRTWFQTALGEDLVLRHADLTGPCLRRLVRPLEARLPPPYSHEFEALRNTLSRYAQVAHTKWQLYAKVDLPGALRQGDVSLTRKNIEPEGMATYVRRGLMRLHEYANLHAQEIAKFALDVSRSCAKHLDAKINPPTARATDTKDVRRDVHRSLSEVTTHLETFLSSLDALCRSIEHATKHVVTESGLADRMHSTMKIDWNAIDQARDARKQALAIVDQPNRNRGAAPAATASHAARSFHQEWVVSSAEALRALAAVKQSVRYAFYPAGDVGDLNFDRPLLALGDKSRDRPQTVDGTIQPTLEGILFRENWIIFGPRKLAHRIREKVFTWKFRKVRPDAKHPAASYNLNNPTFLLNGPDDFPSTHKSCQAFVFTQAYPKYHHEICQAMWTITDIAGLRLPVHFHYDTGDPRRTADFGPRIPVIKAQLDRNDRRTAEYDADRLPEEREEVGSSREDRPMKRPRRRAPHPPHTARASSKDRKRGGS